MLKWSRRTVLNPVDSNGALKGVLLHAAVVSLARPAHCPWPNARASGTSGTDAAARPRAWKSWRREIAPRSNASNNRDGSPTGGSCEVCGGGCWKRVRSADYVANSIAEQGSDVAVLHRCTWAEGDALMRAYHDEEWGVPVRDSRLL